MRKTAAVLKVLAFYLLLLPAQDVQAFGFIGDAMLVEYPDLCEDLQGLLIDCTMCHVSSSDFERNPYGADLSGADRDFAAIEDDDSDGDGRTNIEEIGHDCTAPGDAVSPVDSATWTMIKTLFE